MCKFRLLDVIVSVNDTLFPSTTITDFCHELGVQVKFVYLIHSQANGKVDSANKVILKGIKKKLDDAKGLRVELLQEILWSYHTMETPFTMVYRVMLCF